MTTTPRIACKHCGYMTRIVELAVCTDCQDKGLTDVEPTTMPLHDELTIMLFASSEVGPLRSGKLAWYWGREGGDGWAGPFDTAADAALDMVRISQEGRA